MKRTVSRILAMMVLYNYDMTKDLNLSLVDDIIQNDIEVSKEEIPFDTQFMMQLVEGVVENQRKIDYTISIHLHNYTLDRLSYIDRSIIRIGTFELMFTNTPTEIIINEAIEISKTYSEIEQYDSSKFNHALLDKIAKGLKDGK